MERYDIENRYSLFLESTGKHKNGKWQVKYMFCEHLAHKDPGTMKVIFSGDDFYPSPMISDPEGPRSASALMSFLTLREGDTDPEYFDPYTPTQTDFRDNDAEGVYQDLFFTDWYVED